MTTTRAQPVPHAPRPIIPRRRGVAAVIVVMMLAVLQLAVAGMTLTGARDGDLMLKRLDTIRAFYAAEAGMNMAIREMMNGSDEDADGAAGSISNDANPASDPNLSGGRVYVTKTTANGVTTLKAFGRSGDARRVLQATVQ